MKKDPLQTIFPLIDRPSRYLGSEVNRTRKNLEKIKLKIALAFPEVYEIAVSHFGLQILYHILNQHRDIAAERVYAPWIDLAAYLKKYNRPLSSLESNLPLAEFDIIGFSLLYELNFTNILFMLDLAGIPFYAKERDLSFPLIIAGGPCTANPEPTADFFDAMVIGDGEQVIMEAAETWLKWKKTAPRDKTELLKMLSVITGIYIPSFFKPKTVTFGNNVSVQTLTPCYSDYSTITRAVLPDLDQAPFPDAPIIPYGKPIHDRLRLEIARGCTRGCRFCQAGMIYRPVRERSPRLLLAQAEALIPATGYGDLSLLSLSTGDYGCIEPLTADLTARWADQHVSVSLPSIRAGTLTPEMMRCIKKVRKTGFTIAPEAGSQRLRNVLNKNLTEQNITDTVSHALDLGWQVIKLYFMVGLPTETDHDLKALIDLSRDLSKIKARSNRNHRKGRLHISIAPFIPKPHTPFQWMPQQSPAESKKSIFYLKDRLSSSRITVKWQNPETSILEGLMARGDRRLSRLLVSAYRSGCSFDGWSDRFQYGLWEQALSDADINMDDYTVRARSSAEPLPWDHIETKVSKQFLTDELKKALKGEPTPDCRQGDCNHCGVCDFTGIKPIAYNVTAYPSSPRPDKQTDGIRQNAGCPEPYRSVEISYSKLDQAVYFGHLELVNIFIRALNRAQIPVKQSQGFHPKPKISFKDPLPLGLGSLNETCYLAVPNRITCREIVTGLNNHLPKGLKINDCRTRSSKRSKHNDEPATYLVKTDQGRFDKIKLKDFILAREVIYTRVSHKNRSREIDLKQSVINIELMKPDILKLTLRSKAGQTVRPYDVIEKIFSLTKEEAGTAHIIKIKP